MLVTSGQVSVAVSSGIVFLCTAALFLSGYVLQQRTLRDLREAIKQPPRPSPKIFLPDRFKQSTTELADGTVVALDDDGNRVQGQDQDQGQDRDQDRDRDQNRDRDVVGQKPVIVEVRPTLPGDAVGKGGGGGGGEGGKPTKTTVKGGKKKGKGGGGKEGAEEPQKPMSRAERRRRIKEEIQKSAQGERGYYRRRLW
ncbi:uncharacterized protein B0H64DRAFT_429591 [Chaetomium fimeti]|uniref:Uncharacterized protein n=1 Tax=Chaetomium fimeti TaxID=1854472 RepID=A0AAE0LV13_9PEZI|nr:hypothetical protein B0H64DRAFT_429591 [Chaetomium fimeti]